MKKYFYYNSWDIVMSGAHNVREQIPGGDNFKDVFKFFGPNITFVDRTGVLKTPLKTDILDNMRMPAFVKTTDTFEDICDARAIELFEHAKSTGKKIAIMYSGGIDSTSVCCSFIRTRTDEELKKYFVILMSEVSIEENPNFASNFIFKKFNVMSSFRYTYFVGHKDYIIVTGENADQLFGSQINDYFAAEAFNYTSLFNPIDTYKGKVIDFMKMKLNGSTERSEYLFYKLKRVTDAAPIPIDTTYKFFWWLNFATKWQSVYVRLLPFSKKLENVKFEDNYTTFFHTDRFQLWSMNNSDNFVKADQDTVKYKAKEYIFTVTKDPTYNKKHKVGSLWRLVLQKQLPKFLYIDEDGVIKRDFNNPTQDRFNFDNDFIG